MDDTVIRNNTMDLIFLVSCAVNSEKPDKKKCDKMELSAVLNMAIRHSLSVAAATALEQVMTLPEDFKEAKYKAVRRQSLLNVEREKVIAALEDNGIWYIPLKGIEIKNHYPETAMREMADNDILCDSEKTAEIKTLMEGLGFACIYYKKAIMMYIKCPPGFVLRCIETFLTEPTIPINMDILKNQG